MKHPRAIAILFVAWMACMSSFGAEPDGSRMQQPAAHAWATTDLGDELAKVDVTNGVRLIVPPGRHTGAIYQLSASFAGDHEKAVSLFEWAGDDSGTGMWERRAFSNSRWNGNPATGTLLLETGRGYLIVCHQKGGVPPLNNEEPWIQTNIDHAPNGAAGEATDAPAMQPAQTPPEYPSAAARFADDADTATVSLAFVKTNNAGRALSAN